MRPSLLLGSGTFAGVVATTALIVASSSCGSHDSGSSGADSGIREGGSSAPTDGAPSSVIPVDAGDAGPDAPACVLPAAAIVIDAGADGGVDGVLDASDDAGDAGAAGVTVVPTTTAPLRAFIGTDAAALPLVVTLPSSVTSVCALTATRTLTDVNGSAVAVGTYKFPVSAGANAVTIPLSPPDVGYYGVQLAFAGGADPVAATYQTSIGVLRPLTALQTSQDPATSKFGTNTHFDQGTGDFVVGPQLLQMAGMRWVRDTIAWTEVETKKGTYTVPDTLTTVFGNLKTAGIDVLGVLVYHTGFYDDGSAAEATAYGAYASFVASSFSDTVQAYELWNEPEDGPWYISPDDYPAFLAAGYTGVKSGNAQAPVVGLGGASVGGFDNQYTGPIVTANVAGSMDSFSIHPYVTPGNVDVGYVSTGAPAPLADITNADALTSGFAGTIAAAHDGGARPGMWITEMGWPSASVGLVPQAQQLARSYALVAGLGTLYARVFPYDFFDDSTQPDPDEASFGVINLPDYSLKPGYVAIATTTRALDGRPLIGRLTASNDALQIFVFGPADDPMIAAWASEIGPSEFIADPTSTMAHAGGNPDLSVPVSFTIAGSSATVHDWQDRETTVAASNGALSVSLTPWPIFIGGVGDAASIALAP